MKWKTLRTERNTMFVPTFFQWKLGIPGRGCGGGPPRPGCAGETGASTPCAAASSPVSPPESPLKCPLAPPASGSDGNTHTHTKRVKLVRRQHIKSSLFEFQQKTDAFWRWADWYDVTKSRFREPRMKQTLSAGEQKQRMDFSNVERR